MRASEILTRLSGVRRTRNGWMARCPAHADSNPSLSIREGSDGSAVLHCFAGCSSESVRVAIGVNPDREQNAPRFARRRGSHLSNGSEDVVGTSGDSRITATYDYRNDSGELLYQVVRREYAGNGSSRRKTFRARRPPRHGEIPRGDGWVYELGDTQLVPYRLPELVDAKLVYVVEGEKDADTLASMGLVATCNPFGAGKWRPELSIWFEGRNVVILPDNDDPGRRHAQQVASSLAGTANEVFLVELPGLPPKGDVSDFVGVGGTTDDLIDLVARAEAWSPGDSALAISVAPRLSFTFTSVRRLLEEPRETVSFIWDGTLPTGGFSIVSAKPKAGKSTLVRNLAVAVSRGTPFLNRATVQGRVIYLALEEKRSEIANHFRSIGADTDDILVHTGTAPERAIEELAGAIAEIRPKLVIIDPLSRVLRANDFNDYASMTKILEPLIDLVRATGCHILGVHHDSKMERSGGDALLGSTALFAAVDSHIQIKRSPEGRTICTTQRYGEDLPKNFIDLDPTTGVIIAKGDAALVRAAQAKEAIREFIVEAGPVGEDEIKDRFDTTPRGEVAKVLRELVDAGEIVREGEGKKGSKYLYSKPLARAAGAD